MHLLLIAYYLSILTFYLGVLIYALPIPLTGLKKWGPKLITDAFFIAILTLSLNTIVNVAEYLRALAGGSWEVFLLQIKSVIAFRTVIVFLFSIFSNIFSKFLPGINRLITLITNPILTSLYSNMLLYSIATVVYRGIWLLSSLGIFLMAIPFRIARNAGAFIFSFALVFYIALPLYPSFYRILLYSPSTPLETPIIYGSIINEFGQPISDGYIGIEIKDSYIGPVPLYSSNYIFFTTNSKMLSSPTTIYFDVVGHQFYTNISNINLHDVCFQNIDREFYLDLCRIDIQVKGLIMYSNGIALHILPKVSNVSLAIFTGEYIKLTIDSQFDSELFISIVDAYSIIEVTIDNATSASMDGFTSYQWYWYDLMGSTYIINIPQGSHIIEIKMRLNDRLFVEPSEAYSYATIQQMFSVDNAFFADMLNEIARIAYIDLIASLMFLSLLTSISWGLSRLIGASGKIRVLL